MLTPVPVKETHAMYRMDGPVKIIVNLCLMSLNHTDFLSSKDNRLYDLISILIILFLRVDVLQLST
jgi:hypothetical protein